MTTINGGSAVPGGYYLSKSNWEIFPVARDGERLPGPVSEHYVKVNTAAALLMWSRRTATGHLQCRR